MRNVMVRSVLLLAALLAAPVALARDEAPDAMLNAVTAEVMAILDHGKELQAGSAAKVTELVETKILPLFDFPRIAQTALARHWHLASPEQQAMLTAECKTLVVRTYSEALANLRNQAVEFKRMRMAPGDMEVRVKSKPAQPGKDHMAIDYDLEMTPAGWKVYDIKLGGVSLVSTYRESFAGAVRDDGVDGLIRSLSDKNRLADTEIKPARTTFRDQSRIMFAMLQSALQSRR